MTLRLTEKARQLDELMAKHFPNDPLRPSLGATAEATLSGLIAWMKQWQTINSNDDARILLIWNSGYRDDRAATFIAAVEPKAFEAMIAMATPREWIDA